MEIGFSLGLTSQFKRPFSVSISFDPATLAVDATAASGTVIAQASVNGQDGPHTLTLTDDAGGQFAITPAGELTVGLSALAAGAQSFTIRADNGVDDPVVASRSVSVTAAPANTAAPVISGAAEVGGALTLSDNGAWTGFPIPTFAYQWRRNGVDIDGATGASYTLVLLDDTSSITCRVTATNSNGSASADSNSISLGAPVIYRRRIETGDYASRVRFEYDYLFENAFNDGFCLFAKFVFPATPADNAPIFSSKVDGGLNLAVRNSNRLELSNWQDWQAGTTVFSEGDIVSVFVRHAGGVTTMHTQKEGDVAPVQEFSTAITFNKGLSGGIFWGGAGDTVSGAAQTALGSALYESAVWVTADLGEAIGLDLLNGTMTISDVATPTNWFDPLTGADKTNTMPMMKNWGDKPSGLMFGPSDVTATIPDDFVVLRDLSNSQPFLYDAGDGPLFWAVYDNRDIPGGVKSFWLASSPDLVSWTGHSEVIAAGSGQAVSDFAYMGGKAGSHDRFFLFYSTGGGSEAVINLTTSNDLSLWTADPANPVFSNPGGPGLGIEDFRLIEHEGTWCAVYEHDLHQINGAHSIGAALHTGVVPSGRAWVNQTDDILGTSDVGYRPGDAGYFCANPALVRQEGVTWMLYEGVSFGTAGRPCTLARRLVLTPGVDFFDPANWEKFGVACWDKSRKMFANCAYVENGVIQILSQDGPGATSGNNDGISKIAFRSIVETVGMGGDANIVFEVPAGS